MSMVNVKNLGFGGTGIPDALPQAIAELQGMRLTCVTGAAAGTVMPVPGMDPEDTIGAAVDLTGQADIPTNTLTVQGRNAFGTITCVGTAQDGDTVTVNGRKYTLRDIIVSPSYNTPPGVIAVDVTPSGTDVNLLAKATANAIMSGDSTVTCTIAGAVITVLVRQPGTAGNSYTLAKTGNGFTVSGATFSGGTAAGGGGFVSSASLAGKKILLLWYDKRPGQATNPLLYAAAEQSESPYELTVESLEPESANIGDPSFTLHVHGAGFGPDSKIVFNGIEEPTTFVSYHEVTTGVNMDVWKGPSEPLPVKVRTGFGDDSDELTFQFHPEGTVDTGSGVDTPSGPDTEAGTESGGGHLTFEKKPRRSGR